MNVRDFFLRITCAMIDDVLNVCVDDESSISESSI